MDVVGGPLDLFCTVPPYNMRSIQNRSNSDYDVLSSTNMEKIVHLMWEVLKKAGHRHMFCTELQFSSWHKQFLKVKK